MLSDEIIPHFDYRTLAEYHAVLKRPKLSFSNNDVDKLLTEIECRGLSVVVKPSIVPMTIVYKNN
jgi:hypothetical protein